MNYELGYFTTLSQLGLDKLAGIDSTTSLYLKLSQLSEEQLEKVAEEAGITKEAILPFLGRLGGLAMRGLRGIGGLFPRSRMIKPSVMGKAETAFGPHPGYIPKEVAVAPARRKKVPLGRVPQEGRMYEVEEEMAKRTPSRVHPAAQVVPETPTTTNVRNARTRQQVPPAAQTPPVPRGPFQHQFATTPEAPVIMGGLPRQNVPVQMNLENIQSMTPAGWKMPRGLKWGLGLGGAGAIGYSMFGNGGTPQPQQYYGEGIDPRILEQYAAQGIDPRMLQ